MRLAALSYGHGVSPDRVSGRVVAVFPRACEILTKDDSLITLVTEAAGALPGGIVIDAPIDFAFAGCVAEQAEASVRGGTLRFADSPLTIDLRAMTPWRSEIVALDLDIENPWSLRAWELTRDALVADGRTVLFLSIARALILEVIDASHRLDEMGAKNAAARLIGLGDGTTPAGDDFLVGHLGGLWSSTRRDAARLKFVTRAGQNIATMAPRTHRVSRAYLEAAATGEVSEKLNAVAVAMGTGSDAGLREAAAAAIAVGHTSGACAVLGLLVGTAAFDQPASARALIAL